MRGTGIGTSLILIAVGAVLAFGVNTNTTGFDVNAIGIILLLVGVLGMIISFVFLEGWSFAGPSRAVHHDDRASGETGRDQERYDQARPERGEARRLRARHVSRPLGGPGSGGRCPLETAGPRPVRRGSLRPRLAPERAWWSS